MKRGGYQMRVGCVRVEVDLLKGPVLYGDSLTLASVSCQDGMRQADFAGHTGQELAAMEVDCADHTAYAITMSRCRSAFVCLI